MPWRVQLGILAVLIFCQSAYAEGFKCTLHHVTNVGPNSSYQDDTGANPNTDFFLALDEKSGKGTSSSCTPSGCTENSDVVIIERHDDDADLVRSIRLLSDSGFILWSLEGYRDAKRYKVTSVSVNGQLSQSRFGECTKIIQSANK
jgi:hypothetical protein